MNHKIREKVRGESPQGCGLNCCRSGTSGSPSVPDIGHFILPQFCQASHHRRADWKGAVVKNFHTA